jgi:hypothetical protein
VVSALASQDGVSLQELCRSAVPEVEVCVAAMLWVCWRPHGSAEDHAAHEILL